MADNTSEPTTSSFSHEGDETCEGGRINSYPHPPTVKRPERNVMLHTLVIVTVDQWSLGQPCLGWTRVRNWRDRKMMVSRWKFLWMSLLTWWMDHN